MQYVFATDQGAVIKIGGICYERQPELTDLPIDEGTITDTYTTCLECGSSSSSSSSSSSESSSSSSSPSSSSVPPGKKWICSQTPPCYYEVMCTDENPDCYATQEECNATGTYKWIYSGGACIVSPFLMCPSEPYNSYWECCVTYRLCEGACCVGASCSETTQSQCTSLGGTFHQWVPCSPGLCP